MRILRSVLLGFFERPNCLVELFGALLEQAQPDIRLHVVGFETQRGLQLPDGLGQLVLILGAVSSLKVLCDLGRDDFHDDELIS